MNFSSSGRIELVSGSLYGGAKTRRELYEKNMKDTPKFG